MYVLTYVCVLFLRHCVHILSEVPSVYCFYAAVCVSFTSTTVCVCMDTYPLSLLSTVCW